MTRRMLSALRRDDRGAVGPMIAVLGVSLLGAAGLALDVGLYRLDERGLRAATEAAALSAAMNPAQANARARDYLTRNGYDPAVLRTVTVGRYCADSGLASTQRFDPTYARCPGNGTANAVRIETHKASRRFMTRVFGGQVVIPELTSTATAARIDEAGVEVSSGLLTVSNSLVNSVNDLLGALIGIRLRLSTADIEALMGGNVDAGLFFDRLAQRAGHTGTYGELVQGTYGLGDIAASAADATSNASTAAALRVFGGQVGNGYRVPLNGLFGLGVWKNMPVGEADAKPALRAGMNAYQLLSFAVQAGPGAIDLSDTVSLAVPGSTVRVAAVASGPMDRPRFAFGPAGETTVGTSMLRLQLQLGLGDINILGLGLIRVNSVPLLIDVAAAQASVSAIDCPNTAEQAQNTRVTVAASSGLVNAYIGKLPANAMTKPIPPVTAADIGQERLVDVLGLVTIDARAIAQPVIGNNASLVFGPGGNGTIGSPTAAGVPGTIGNGSQLGTTVSSLVGSLTAANGLELRVAGICVGCGLLRSQLLSDLTGVLSGLLGSTADPLLDNVLAALGIQLGHAKIWVNGARCGVPVLV